MRRAAGLGCAVARRDPAGELTPYSEMTLGTSDKYRIGMNWQAGTRFELNLLGERSESGSKPAEHSVLLKGEVSF